MYDAVAAVCLARGWHEVVKNVDIKVMHVPFSSCGGVATFDADGLAVSFALGPVVSNALHLRWSFTSARGHARWQCFDGLVRYCYANGIEILVNDSALFIESGQLEFQRELGFHPYNLRISHRAKKAP